MAGWTTDELDTIGRAEEVRITSRRPDGTLRPEVIIWAVRSGDDVYVRSAYGPEGRWYRNAVASGVGRISAEGVQRDVAFVDVGTPGAADHDAIDAAYHDKYDRHGPKIVGTVVDSHSYPVTLRLEPQD